MGTVAVGEQAADLCAQRAFEGEPALVDERDLESERERGGGDLGADEAGAGDHEPAAGDELRAQA